MLTTARDRIGAALGATFVVLIFVGNSLAVSGTSGENFPSGSQVLKDVAHQADSTTATVGLTLEVLGFVAFFGFLGYLADLLRRRSAAGEGRMAAGTAVVSGIVMLALKLGSGVPMEVLTFDRKTISPDLAKILNDFGAVAFVLSWLPFAVFVGALALSLRETGAVGRPTAWIGYLLGVAGTALTLVGFTDLEGANPMAFLLGMLWLLVVSVRLAVKPGTPPITVPGPVVRDAVAV